MLLPLTLCLSWPVIKLLELTGRWPGALARLMNRAMGSFGDYQPGAHDVLVCSYFKSGTNWTMQIAVQIAHLGQASFEHIHDLVAWPETRSRFGMSIAVPITDEAPWRNAPTGLRVIKTHLPMDKVPYTAAARYICVVRDPKDVFVSSFHFVRSSMLGPLMPSKARWLENFLSPNTISGSWAAHLHSYWQIRQRDNVLFLTYEEMKRDLPATVRRIARLMNVTLTAQQFDAVVQQSSFSHMKQIGLKFDMSRVATGGRRAGGAMIRRGESGSAGELLSIDQQRRIDDYWCAQLERLGCDFPYAQAFGAGSARARQASGSDVA
ncbi:MAG TPA: sulfotransferase domain-containing protein [Steroidobacteraceae bacterium]|nr:sulfotransferase domain-containing protein [Steroidobacteraceae bacterium]